MKLAAAVLGILVGALAVAPALQAQVTERAVERVSVALLRPLRLDSGVFSWTNPSPRKLGVFTIEPPTAPGEVLRVRLPIGELVSKAARSVTAAHQGRREAAARREVEAALRAFCAEGAPGPTNNPRGTRC